MKIKEQIEKELLCWQKMLDFVNSKAEAFQQLEEAGLTPRLAGTDIDFDNLKREQVLKVIEVLRVGKWEKSPNYSGKALDYTNVQDGFNVRLWGAQPPNSCQLIEEEVELPPEPARKVKKFKLVCTGASNAI